MTYVEILDIIFDNGRILADPSDYEAYQASVAVEAEFEATEALARGELDGSVAGAVEFALNHI